MTSQRAVTFIDVLGFRDKIFSIPLETLASDYERTIAAIRALNNPFASQEGVAPALFPKAKPGERWCIQHVFSDSIILFALDDSDESFLKLVVYTWRITQSLLAMGMHPRGAVTFGEMYINETSNIFLGKALSEAYELEQRQDWIGVALSPSASIRYNAIVDAIASPENGQPTFLVRHLVPLKRKGTSILTKLFGLFPLTRYEQTPLVVINWRWNLVAKEGTRSLLPTNSSPSVRAKTKNTIKYLEGIVQSGALYPTEQDKFPVELRTFYIGNSDPPFPHGDSL